MTKKKETKEEAAQCLACGQPIKLTDNFTQALMDWCDSCKWEGEYIDSIEGGSHCFLCIHNPNRE